MAAKVVIVHMSVVLMVSAVGKVSTIVPKPSQICPDRVMRAFMFPQRNAGTSVVGKLAHTFVVLGVSVVELDSPVVRPTFPRIRYRKNFTPV